MACGSQSQFTFTVNNVFNFPNIVSYNWTAYGWKRNGVSVGNFSTTTNTVTLTPGQYPPSNITVSVNVNGTFYNANNVVVVSTAPFTSANTTLTGPNSICTVGQSGTYTINTPPAALNITWSIDNTSIGVLTSTTSNSATVNKIASGSFNLTATVTNACGQSVYLTKLINGVIPSTPLRIIGPSTVATGAVVNYRVDSAPSATSYLWHLPYPYNTVNSFDYNGQRWQKLANASSSNSISVFTGLGRFSGQIQVMAVNEWY